MQSKQHSESLNSSELNSHALWLLLLKCFNSNTEALWKQQHSLKLFDLGSLKLFFCIFVYFISEGMLALLSILLTRPRFIKDLIFIVHCKLVCFLRIFLPPLFLSTLNLLPIAQTVSLVEGENLKAQLMLVLWYFYYSGFPAKWKLNAKERKHHSSRFSTKVQILLVQCS